MSDAPSSTKKPSPHDYVKSERIRLKAHPQFNERWVQDRIEKDPFLLGLGDLAVLDAERKLPGSGRLDLLLRDKNDRSRYEVELQLGATDPSHIVRTIEYWDIEKKRYPNHKHCAVLIAEDITGRFVNVVRLLSGVVPFVAIQMEAVKVGDSVTLVFTKVVDERDWGPVHERSSSSIDRPYWDKHVPQPSMALVDQVFDVVKGFDPSLSLNYKKKHIGMAKDGRPFNFVAFRPMKTQTNLRLKLPHTDEFDAAFQNTGLGFHYWKGGRAYVVHLKNGDSIKGNEGLEELIRQAYEHNR